MANSWQSQVSTHPGHGEVKVDSNLVKSGVLPCANSGTQIRNPNIEIRDNFKTRISNNQNIPRTYTISTCFYHVLNFVFWSLVFISSFVLRISNLKKTDQENNCKITKTYLFERLSPAIRAYCDWQVSSQTVRLKPLGLVAAFMLCNLLTNVL